ncbi:mechanosensitive ion channel domain-containing protein [Dyadobacter sp. CY312]|uniref:mechanosensitive ion channel domain-containing protein n=1 Tax=Dyadobacter sp. CY312 TaxID=2907303 RepID=UPI001F3B0A66|nr:mechanosensitive ion channel domain-containing protein [Dyadobacter sp. CY312]MCE7038747.1 mechanosensitive ion channel [Dyadobacter sp. CY312]
MKEFSIVKFAFAFLVQFLFVQLLTPSLGMSHMQQDTIPAGAGKVIPDTLLFRLEKVQAELAQINASNKKGYNTGKIRKELSSNKTNLDQITAALRISNPLPASKDLVNYRIMLTDIQKNTGQLRDALSKYNSDLQRMSENIIGFSGDSLLNIDDRDTTQRTLYNSQIADLKNRLQKTGEVTVAHLDTLSRLLADASAIYFSANDVQVTIDDYLKDADNNVLQQEAGYLWKSPITDKSQKMARMIRVSYAGQDKILRYFFNSTWDNRILLLLIVSGFFAWVYFNYRLVRKPYMAALAGDLNFRFIKPVPILACLVILFNLTPLFEPNSPSIYIEMNQFLLLITLSLLFYKTLDKSKMKWWIIMVALYVATILFNVIVNDSLILRTGLIALSIASVYIGIRFYRRADITSIGSGYIKPVIVIHVILTLLSVLLNIFGRLSLAKSLNITGISGIIQLLSLAVFVQVVSEALELQIKASACSGGIFSKINISRTRQSLKKGLAFLSLWLWGLVFLINLNIVGPVGRLTSQILEKQRTIGSLAFTFENILFFSITIWLANLLQKNIGLFFGEEDMDFTNNKIRKGSKMALVRLLVIVIGFLFAITVSGVPLDKITVLLGALGVGIGLGLQTIINNFVSGIILIFERPFSIGDYIELADKKGKVMEIGIRASKMLTPQGSRIIIPNGDLLSGRLVNYTTHNARLKIELTLKVSIEADVEMVKKLIGEIVNKGDGIVKKAPKQILFNALTVDSIELKTLVWVNDVYAEPTFRSYFLEQVYQTFPKNGIKLM